MIDLLNLKPGPVIGKVLNQLFDEVEEGKLVNENEILKSRVLEIGQEMR